MNAKYLVVHTYKDIEETKKHTRPVWRSIINDYPDREKAFKKMSEAFTASLTSGMIAASFYHDTAYIETIDGEQDIWTITKVEG